MGTDLIAVEGIVSCPNCGAANRVRTYSAALRPICGRCKTPLGAATDKCKPHQPTTSNPPFRASRPKKKRKWAAYFTIALAVGAGATFYVTFINSSSRSASPPAYSPYPHHAPSRLSPPTWEQPATQERNRRLPNGTFISSAPFTGNGRLTVDNGTEKAAAVKLVNKLNQVCQAYLYVAANSKFTLAGIPDGEYRLLFATGFDWDYATAFFTRKTVCSEFDNPIDFNTTTKRRGSDTLVLTSTAEITLHPVRDGTASTHRVREAEFQKY